MRTIVFIGCLSGPAISWAQLSASAPDPQLALPTIVVTATRGEGSPFDTLASISRVSGSEIRTDRGLASVTEVLGSVPGLLARDRQNYAQDAQISVRGFGARSTFGIRGVRLYVDGIPATQPDGQGQISHLELGAIDRIEVLRGPFSALYGNSSGGVIQAFTAEGGPKTRLGFDLAGGSDGMLRMGVNASGRAGDAAYAVSATKFHTDGFRDHSAADRSLGNAKFTLHPDADSKLTLVANSASLPDAQDPLGLSRAQFQTNPRGVDPSALAYNTRKSVNQTQAGLTYERSLNAANNVQMMAYQGHRTTEQFQSIPKNSQGSPTHPGGVIDLTRDYRGTDLRWTHKSYLNDAPFTVIAGLAYDELSELRRGYQNFVGTTLGITGALRRDENNKVFNVDQYVQSSWQLTPQFTIDMGVRHSSVRIRSDDHYVTVNNPNDSARNRFDATLPVLGAMYALNPRLKLYATAGRGFETPTLNEMAYRPAGVSGQNFALKAATSNSLEAGVKARLDGNGELGAAVFETRTKHEIVTLSNVGGRSTFQNAGGTLRRGLELSWSDRWWESLKGQAAFTWLSAEYSDSFRTCTATPCNTPNVTIPSGNRIPGIARGALFASLAWMPQSGWRSGVELRHLTRIAVNDANTEHAGSFTVASAYAGYAFNAGRWKMSTFARCDNLTNRRYAGSVIVNEGNGRYFEPAPGRTWVLGTSATLQF